MSEPTQNDQPEAQPAQPEQPAVAETPAAPVAPAAPEVPAAPQTVVPTPPEYVAPAAPAAPENVAPEAPVAPQYVAPEAAADAVAPEAVAPEQPQYAPAPPVYQAPEAAQPQYAGAPPVPPVPPIPVYGAPQQASGSKVFAIVALVSGILAFLTGFLPYVGIVFGGVAIGFGIAALVKKQSKGFAIPGLALGAVGLLISLFMAFVFGAVITSVNSQSGTGGSSSSERAPGGADSDEDFFGDDEQTDADDSGSDSSREHPLALGTTFTTGDWEVTVNSVELNANAAVAAENQFNDAPAKGNQFIMPSLTVKYLGDETGYPYDVRVDYVTATGEVISDFDVSVVEPEPSFGSGELYAGGTSTGNVVLSVPSTLDGVLRIQSGYDSDKFFVAIK